MIGKISAAMCVEASCNIVQEAKLLIDSNPIQIDEARFTRKRKYNHGRMLNGDTAPISEDSDADVQNNRNHGCQIDGPWVFWPQARL